MLRELLAHPGVVEELRLAGPVGVMALHGGIEEHTAGLARQIADRAGASLYVVEQPSHLAWHVPSTSFDPRDSHRLTRFLERARMVLSVHGFGRPHLRRTVLLGGRNRRLASELATELARRTDLVVVDDLERIPRGLRGLHPANPVNLAERRGVQIELSASARGGAGRERVVAAVAAVARRHSRSLCAPGPPEPP